MLRTGPGPYRTVHDQELRGIFYLTPQSGRAFMLNVQVQPFIGSERPIVTLLLRAMLYVLVATPAQIVALRRTIEVELPARNDIVIRAKLLSLIGRVRSTPWAYPALLDTPKCRRLYHELKPIVEASDTVGNAGADPVTNAGVSGALIKFVSSALAFGWNLANYFGGKSKDYYEFHLRRISEELALRGIPPSMI